MLTCEASTLISALVWKRETWSNVAPHRATLIGCCHPEQILVEAGPLVLLRVAILVGSIWKKRRRRPTRGRFNRSDQRR